jgi:hypothetical protein
VPQVVVLYIDEATSVHRQLARQAHSAAHNQKVRDARVGSLMCEAAPVLICASHVASLCSMQHCASGGYGIMCELLEHKVRATNAGTDI